MPEKRRYQRVRPRGLVSVRAKIYEDKNSPVIDCTVVDESVGGACLEIDGSGAIPRRFVFVRGGVRKAGHLIWQRGRRIGVAF